MNTTQKTDAGFRPGLLPSEPKPKDYLGGGVTGIPDEPVLPSGDWRPYKSMPHEMQLRFGRDFMSCTNFAGTDTVEALMFYLFGERHNFSDRALAIFSGLTQNGNSLWAVAEAIRTKGLVHEDLLPWTAEQDTFEKFTSCTEEQRKAIEAAGLAWLDAYDFGWEWVYDNWGKGMRWGLQRSPLFAASLYANESSKDAQGVYHTDLPNSDQTTHAIVLLNQTTDDYKDIDDSYLVQEKRLNKDFRVPVGMRFWIAKKQPNTTPMFYPPKNSLVIVADSGERMMYVDGDRIFKDDAGKIVLEVEARNAKNGFSAQYPICHVKADQIKHLQRVNLKGEHVA